MVCHAPALRAKYLGASIRYPDQVMTFYAPPIALPN